MVCKDPINIFTSNDLALSLIFFRDRLSFSFLAFLIVSDLFLLRNVAHSGKAIKSTHFFAVSLIKGKILNKVFSSDSYDLYCRQATFINVFS